MVSAYKKGLKRTLTYYLVGLLLAISIHLIFGWKNFSIMPRSTLVIVVVLLIALPWTILNITNLICPVKRPQNLGELVVHGIILMLAAGWIAYLRIHW